MAANGARTDEIAFLPHGGGSTCPSSSDGSVISQGSKCSLTDNTGAVWTYNGGQSLLRNGVDQGQKSEFGLGNCAGGCASRSPFWALAIAEPSNGGGHVWFNLWFGIALGQVISPVSPLSQNPSNPSTHLFKNITTNIPYSGMQGMVTAAHANDHLHSNTLPAGLPAFFDGGVFCNGTTCSGDQNGVTLTCDPGEANTNYGLLGGKAVMVIDANNVTIDGCDAFHYRGGWGYGLDNGFTGFTLKNSFASYDAHCILTGGYNGTITISNVTFDNCGDVSGPSGHYHNMYIGQERRRGYDATAVNIDHVTATNVQGSGHEMKIRVPFATVTNSILACTVGGQYGCRDGVPLDFPCGGVSTATSLVIERGPNNDNFQFVNFGTELTNGNADCGDLYGNAVAGRSTITGVFNEQGTQCSGSDPSPAGCGISVNAGVISWTADWGALTQPMLQDGTTVTSISGPDGNGKYTLGLSKAVLLTGQVRLSPAQPSQSLLLDKIIFINDGPGDTFTYKPISVVWNRDMQQSLTVTVQNSIIVNNPNDTNGRMVYAHGLWNNTGKAVIIGTGNLCYASRTAAFGPGHDFPYLPPPLTGNPVANGREVTCPSS